MMIIGDKHAPFAHPLQTPNGVTSAEVETSKNIVWSTTDWTGIDSIFYTRLRMVDPRIRLQWH